MNQGTHLIAHSAEVELPLLPGQGTPQGRVASRTFQEGLLAPAKFRAVDIVGQKLLEMSATGRLLLRFLP